MGGEMRIGTWNSRIGYVSVIHMAAQLRIKMRTFAFLVLIVVVFGLAACSGDDASNATPRLVDTSWTREKK